MTKNQISRFIYTGFLLLCTLAVFSQVTLTATSGTATGSFTTLKGAFDAINAGTHKGAIVIKINSSTTEAASAALNASAALSTSAPYYTSISIYPTTTGLSISGALATPLINLNGAKNVTIDGRVNATGTTKSLTITNTSAVATAGTSTIRFINDATNNTIQYCTLKGSTTDAAAGIVFFSTATTTGNDNNIITNNDITCAADASRPLNAIYALGTSLKNNDSITISNNNIYNVLSKATASQGINISSYNSTFTISENSFYETASFTATAAVNYNIILINAATGTGNGFTITGNYIGGSAALCAGTAWTKTAQNNAFTAISVTTATGTANSIQGNTIQNINWTNAGTAAFTAISLSGATVANIGTTTGNTIGAATGTGSITFTSTTTATDFFGISIASTDVVSCQNNTIGSITVANAATNATNFSGIYKTATAGTTTISNNTIGSTTTASSINASSASSTAGNAQSVWGIRSAGTGTVTISGNTIANMVNATSNTTTTTAGLISGINISAGTNTISDNEVHDFSIANTNTSVTGTASVTGIVVANATAAVQTVSGNTLYNLSNSNASFAGGVIGISYSGSTTASAVKGNFIHSLSVSGATSTTASLYGIKIDAGATTYSNNIISLGGNTKTNIYGFYQTGAASNNNSLFFNTVNIAGSLVSGATNTSYALYSTATTNTRDFRNNIFVNTRSTIAGANLHYAIYIAASGGTLTCDYNNYFVSGTGGVLGFFGAAKTALPIVTGATGNDANSIATNPSFGSTGTTASDYIPTVRGAGVTGTGIGVDYDGKIRGTVLTMGGFELKQGADAPTAATVTASVQSAIISFTAPVNTGGGPITNYEYSINNGSTWTALSPAQTTSPLIIRGLTNCTEYNMIIRAVNVIGGGSTSNNLTVTPLNGKIVGDWNTRTTSVDNYWNSVTYGNGQFVAVSQTGTGNRVMTSNNGVTWTIRSSAAENGWTSVTYGNGLFVAVANTGTGNRVMTSPDGITWTSRTSAADNYWTSVTFGNGLFVAVALTGTGNRVMTSPDGINWTTRTSATNNSWMSVTYGNGLFVAVSQDGIGNRVMTSPDGITWTSRSSAADNYWNSVTFGNGLFVAVSSSGTGNRVMTSADGINWTLRTSVADNSWASVTYGNGTFVAVSFSGIGNRVMASLDGITWTSRTSAADNYWNSVTFGNGLFVAVSSSGTGNRVMTGGDALTPGIPVISSITTTAVSASVTFTGPNNSGSSSIANYEYTVDGNIWTTCSVTSPLNITNLTQSSTYPVIIRAVNMQGVGCASAAVNATTLAAFVPNAPTSLVVTPGAGTATISFVEPSNNGNASITNYEYSLNSGVTWTALFPANIASPITIPFLDVCTSKTILIRAVNIAGSGLVSEPVTVKILNGQRAGLWTTRTAPGNNNWTSITFGKGLFVAVANTSIGNRVMTSQDGVTWISRNSAANNDWQSITFGNGLFVAVANTGSGNRVMTSPDGITWTTRNSAADNNWTSVTYGNGLFVAVANSGTGNRVMTSPDGINWTIRVSASDNNWTSVTYGNGLFVAVSNSGSGNRVMISSDGINWTTRNSAADNQWTSVSYGNGIFVAVASSGTGNRVMTSSDAVNWTIRNFSRDRNWKSISFGNGLFVAVAGAGSSADIITSNDGINWTVRLTNILLNSITCGKGIFVTVGNGSVITGEDQIAPDSPVIDSITTTFSSASVWFTAPSNTGSLPISDIQYTTDGNLWTGQSSTSNPVLINNLSQTTNYGITIRAYNGLGSFAGCPSNTVNATTLTAYVPNAPTNLTAIAGHGSAYISFTSPSYIGNAPITNYEYSLDNGNSWMALHVPKGESPITIPGLSTCTSYAILIRAVNVAGGGTASSPVVVTTQNGQEPLNWSNSSSFSPQPTYYNYALESVAYGGGIFVAVGRWNQVITSLDGINWTSVPCQDIFREVTYGNGLFLAIGDVGISNHSAVMTSPDGITWTSHNVAPTSDNWNWNCLTYGNGLFVVQTQSETTGQTKVMTSPDGIVWTVRYETYLSPISDICYGNGLFVGVVDDFIIGGGYSNIYILSSPDGINWTQTSNMIVGGKITYGNGLFVVLSAVNSTVFTSPDGINWTEREIGHNLYGFNDITFGNGYFMAVGNWRNFVDGPYQGYSPSITSRDGIHWNFSSIASSDSGMYLANYLSVTYGKGRFVAVSDINYNLNPEGLLLYGVKPTAVCNLILPPDKPVISSIIPSITSATVHFTAPTDTGTSAISNYEYSLDGGNTWVTPSPPVISSPFSINGLTSGTNYSIRLRALNTDGSSCPSATVSVTTVNLCTPTSSIETASACGSYVWHGITYTTSNNSATWTGTNAGGCDSVVTLNLIIKNTSSSISNISRCSNQLPYSWNGNSYSTAGTYTYITNNAAGCDSIVTLSLTINATTNNTTTASVCDSYTWSLNGQTYTSSGSYTSVIGCSTEILDLTITSTTSNTNTISACTDYLWTANGQTYTTSGTYTVFSNCATEILNLTITSPVIKDTTVTTCGSYSLNGYTYTNTGNYTQHFTAANNCDSLLVLHLTILPLPTNPGPINGITEVCSLIGLSTPTIYTVLPVASAASYAWTVPTGATIVSGAGTNSIGVTFTNALAYTNQRISVVSIAAQGCQSITTSYITLTNTVPGIPTISGPVNVCPYVGASNATYTCDSMPNTNSYLWTAPVGATIIRGQGTRAVEISFNSSFVFGAITVAALSNCGSRAPRSYTVTKSIPTAPLAINGPISACAYIGNAQQVTYSVAPVANAVSYTWTLPSTVTIVSGQGTNSIVVTFAGNYVTSNFKVKSVSNCFTSGDKLLQVLGTTYASPGIISGPTNTCYYINSEARATYSIRKVANAPSYIWTVPAGVTVISHPGGSGVNDTSIVVSFNSNFVTGSQILVQTSGCGTSSPRAITLTRTLPAMPSLISGPTNACEFMDYSTTPNGNAATYKIPKTATASFYTWTAPLNATIIAHPGGTGENDTIVLVKFNDQYTTGSLKVSAGNSCGNGTERTLTITKLNASAPGLFDVMVLSDCPTRLYSYSVANMPLNAVSLVWTVPNGATIVSGQGTRSITVSYPNTVVSGDVTAQSINNCSSSLIRVLTIKIQSCPNPITTNSPSAKMDALIIEGMKPTVYPNPTVTSFKLNVSTTSQEKLNVKVMDLQGRLMKSVILNPNQDLSFGSELKSGVYMVKVKQGEQVKTLRVVKY